MVCRSVQCQHFIVPTAAARLQVWLTLDPDLNILTQLINSGKPHGSGRLESH